MSKEHMGSSLDDFLKQEGDFDEAPTQAIKEVVAWQLAEAMKERKLSKNKMAALLKTSRTQVNRLLDPEHDITLSSLQRAAAIVGRRVTIELVEPAFLTTGRDMQVRAEGYVLPVSPGERLPLLRKPGWRPESSFIGRAAGSGITPAAGRSDAIMSETSRVSGRGAVW